MKGSSSERTSSKLYLKKQNNCLFCTCEHFMALLKFWNHLGLWEFLATDYDPCDIPGIPSLTQTYYLYINKHAHFEQNICLNIYCSLVHFALKGGFRRRRDPFVLRQNFTSQVQGLCQQLHCFKDSEGVESDHLLSRHFPTLLVSLATQTDMGSEVRVVFTPIAVSQCVRDFA